MLLVNSSPSDSSQASLDRVIQRHLLLKLVLGEGSDEYLGEVVAVKVLHASAGCVLNEKTL